MPVYKDNERGTWYFVARVKKYDGTFKQVKKRGFKTKKEAKIAEAEALVADPLGEDMTFEELAKTYFKWFSARRKQSSVQKVKNMLYTHIVPKFGHLKLNNLKTAHVIEYQNELLDKYSIEYIKSIHARLSALLNYAIKHHGLKENVARTVGNIDMIDNKKMEFWTLEEYKNFMKIFEEEENLMYETFFTVLYWSGMRKGEMLALTWEDIDEDTNIITINKTNYYNIIQPPKTPASVRKISMPQGAMELVKKLKEKASEIAEVKNDYLVFGEFYTSLSTTTIDVYYNKYVKMAGVKRIRLHDFRHSHASYLINNKMIINKVAHRLGHGDVAMTLNIYSHLFPSTDDALVDLMNNDF